MNTKVISLGGSIVAPSDVNTALLQDFFGVVRTYLDSEPRRRLIIVVGGGGPARVYQQAYRSIVSEISDDMQDWIGISATRLNAQLLAGVFQRVLQQPRGKRPDSGN